VRGKRKADVCRKKIKKKPWGKEGGAGMQKRSTEVTEAREEEALSWEVQFSLPQRAEGIEG